MFRPARMVKVDCLGIKDEMTQITALLAEAGVVHLSPIGTISGMEDILVSARDDELERRYRNAAENMRRVRDVCGGDPEPGIPSDYLDFDLAAEIEQIEPFLAEFVADIEGIAAKIKALDEDARKYGELKQLTESLIGLDADIAALDSFEFLCVKIGFVPPDKVSLLQKALGEKSVVLVLGTHGLKTLVTVLFLRDDEKGAQKILDAALFQDLVFPPDIAGKPREIIEDITRRLGEITHEKERLEKFAKIMRSDSCEELQRIARRIAAAELHFFARSHFKATRDLVVLSGWVPQRSLKWFEGLVAAKKDDLVVLKDYSVTSKINVPTKLDNIRLLKPFEPLVATYGLPDYKEIDPTLYVMLGFGLMFGMMFGDLGQGAVLALAGWFMRRKRRTGMVRDIGNMVMMCGSVSMVFGVLFGSVFGFENLIPALLFHPFNKINLVLSIAIFWGVAFIGMGIIMNIINKVMQGKYVEALLGQRSLSGILFYFGSVFFVFGLLMEYPYARSFPVLCALVILPLIFVGLKDPVEHLIHAMRAKHGRKEGGQTSGLEIFIMAVMEIYDTILGYLSNTLSFMRVAAFALNHVGLMLAVFVIGDSLDPKHDHTSVGFWLTVVFGNVLVLGLEGMIVTIQTLRLIYYEGFSKFFAGDGIQYKPFSIKTQL